MRVTTGIAKGKKLLAPEGLHTRPITDQIKQAIFSTIQFEVFEAQFLDIFAGSGSMGIEAISRGASKATFIDNDNEAIKIINTNLKNCNFNKDSYEVIKDDAFKVINSFKDNKTFDIIYLDPPFTVDEIFIPIMETIDDSNILKESGILAIRSKKEKKLPDEFNNLIKIKEKKYGISMVHYYKRRKV